MSVSLRHARTFVAALLTTALVSSGCGPGREGPAASSQLQRILAARQLRVGTSADLPPLGMRDKSGGLIGLEIDLVRKLGDAMDLEVQFVQKPFAELLPALERNEVDLVVAGLTITPERNARVAFAGPYFISGASILTFSRELTEVESPAALDGPERTFVALESSTNAAFVQKHMPRAKLVTVPNNESGVQMVLRKEADALIADLQVCTLAQWRNPDAGLHARLDPFTTEPLGIALPPDDPLLLNLVTNYLNTLENTGELAQLKARWLTNGEWVGELP
jgi:polar amino acid transport system substrate-binding protein